jgi:hypothetical protein
VHPAEIRFNQRSFDRLAGGPGLREAIEAGLAPDQIARGWSWGIKGFRERAKPILIYSGN